MKQNLTRFLQRAQQGFAAFTTGQKVVAVVGTLAVLLGAFLVFQWAARPSMAPLYSDLSSTDASAVVEQLEAQGTPYELAGDGTTIMVPRDVVRATRIDMSGEGLPSGSEGGYSLLDDQGLTTSDFKERTDYKRAMEGELSATIESIDGVETALVHLAIPEKQVFEEEQAPTTASVLVGTRTGSTLDPGQVQAVVNLVASSIDGLEPEQVTVADATGKVLSTPGGVAGADGTARAQMVSDVQEEYRARLQSMLDRVVGVGNSTVQVSAELDFDKSVSEVVQYDSEADALPLSSSRSTESYDGAAADGVTGVVGPDGQMDPAAGAGGDGSGSYRKNETTLDNAVGSRSERRESTPGAIERLSIGVVVDPMTAQQANETDVRDLVMGTAGISRKRGDTISVAFLPFDRSAEEAAAAALEEAEAEEAAARRNALIRNAAIGLLVIGALVFLAFRSRRRARQREEETTYIVEQLRERRQAQAALEPSPALLALEESEASRADDLRDELTELIERQPDDVAALLRGWLSERP
ncbi:flagellar basal-body MS-ring/collar protein FliF [Nocardioides sp. SOB77]|uniref:Flagellar M-ring protein n=1 Tax=Nocardioides oceani TaxID=3058369 RepID=A0ABT8FHE0_9ACTN|nr:flagellar basal-body MS-ring/collar protein FliF [Nocardioides oceani]MDN4173562.1 flagellar basal-body MS-ring/collar protein FliF [Nocardioides oceani]